MQMTIKALTLCCAGLFFIWWADRDFEIGSYESCMESATSRQTELGVRLARIDCHRRFLARKEQEAASAEVRRAAQAREAYLSRWSRAASTYKLSEVLKEFGLPDDVRRAVRCAGAERKDQRCDEYLWNLPQEFAATCVPAKFEPACYFRLQTLNEPDKDGAGLVYWPEPY